MDVALSEPAKPTRILYVITKANWGGAQRYVYDVANAAIEVGHDVFVACGTQGELTTRLEQKGIPVFQIAGLDRDVAPIADFKALFRLIRLIRTVQPGAVHANSSKAGLIAVLAARLTGVPHIIFTAHGWAFNETRPIWQKAIFAVFHLVTVWLSDDVICVSEAIKKDASWMPFSEKKMGVIHHGIQLVELKEKNAARAQLSPHSSLVSSQTSSGTAASPLWIGTLAELHPIKGLDVAIESFARIAPQFPHAALVLIGEGHERNRLVALAKKLDLTDRIRFCGHVQHAPRYLSAFDVFLFPSRSEALGYAVLEAGNASLPVVASRVGGIPEIIEDGVSGLLVMPNDVDGFAIALSSLLAAPELRTKLGTALHQKVVADFSHEQMIRKTLAVY
jgi:glycosyltransferase involved in cell wall biosynthesis